MTRFSLFQGTALLPLLLMLVLQEWLAAGAVVVTLIFVLIALASAKKRLEKQRLEAQDQEVLENSTSVNTKAMLVSLLQEEIPPRIDELKDDLNKTQQINSESFTTLNRTFYQLLRMSAEQSASLHKVLLSISKDKALAYQGKNMMILTRLI